ncbi:MAG: hypothetical protein JWR77_2348 [Rhizorhabdus sp.]|nr:hypothetical protein [Rhizorhabdus sp.]
MADDNKADRKQVFGSGIMRIGGKEYPVTGVVVEFTDSPRADPPLDLQELGMQAFERLCDDAGLKCTRIGRSG